ncbi:hypothetical protein, partial [uncultured Tepidimonas sp.]|uniref:hypothetical protein n=1 Tax=uncultured Tepidimonas sp. TaxID=453579 RepID=UPI00262AFD19
MSPADSPLAALSVLPALAVFFAFGASSFEAVAFEALTTFSALTAGVALGVAVFALDVFFAGAFTAVFSVVFSAAFFAGALAAVDVDFAAVVLPLALAAALVLAAGLLVVGFWAVAAGSAVTAAAFFLGAAFLAGAEALAA